MPSLHRTTYPASGLILICVLILGSFCISSDVSHFVLSHSFFHRLSFAPLSALVPLSPPVPGDLELAPQPRLSYISSPCTFTCFPVSESTSLCLFLLIFSSSSSSAISGLRSQRQTQPRAFGTITPILHTKVLVAPFSPRVPSLYRTSGYLLRPCQSCQVVYGVLITRCK
jgi:hypothetical protein